jgi:hypothetical protein
MEKMCSILFSAICGASRLMSQTITSLKIDLHATGMQKAFMCLALPLQRMVSLYVARVNYP